MLQSVSNFIFRLIISKHCGRTPRGVRGVKRSEIYWGIQKYSLPGRPSTHHWVKSKTIIKKHQKLRKIIINQILVNFLPPKNIFYFQIDFFSNFFMNFDAFYNGFWSYSILAGWSTWQWVFSNFSQNLWSFDTPDIPGCASAVIWNRFESFLSGPLSGCGVWTPTCLKSSLVVDCFWAICSLDEFERRIVNSLPLFGF